ncbi:MAG: hypothetical protein H7Y31_09315 [Chitinophagaceae bacterium]|nr:hypothetical protein [Chitinophagaceae bacterium]
MKLVHNSLKSSATIAGLTSDAKEAELAGDGKTAAKIYEEILRKHPLNESAYNRLLILYRQSKQPKKELATINAGIKNFEQFFSNAQKPTPVKKIRDLSHAINKLTGLSDKKGKPVYEPEPIARWRKRKEVVLKKINGK